MEAGEESGDAEEIDCSSGKGHHFSCAKCAENGYCNHKILAYTSQIAALNEDLDTTRR